MIRQLGILGFVLFIGLPAVAQTIVVRSGEHEDFTRLVLQLPGKAGWSIDQSERSLTLTIDAPSVQFDVSNVFDRIPRTRLAALTTDGPGSNLVFSLACACSVSSFVEHPGFLVIDIRDNKNKLQPRRRMVTLPVNQGTYRFPVQVKSEKKVQMGMPELMLPVVIGRVPLPNPQTEPVAPDRKRPKRPHGAINISEERLLAQINRASEQGLLDLRIKPEATETGRTDAGRSESMDTSEHVTVNSMPLPVSLSATTVIDRDLAVVARSIDHSAPEGACLNSDSVAVHNWGGSQPFAAEIGLWRSQLFGEFDRVRSDKALNLARAYLHYGFGAEAMLAIDLSSLDTEESRVLQAIARILDQGNLADRDPFAGQQNCDGDAALWAVLAAESIAEDTNNNAIQLAFARLPQHLRSYLGPRISQKFSEAGDSVMASGILRMVARIEVEPGSGVALAKAAVAELQGDTETAGHELSKSLASGTGHSPEALVRLIDYTFKNRGSVAPDLPDLAAAYALEFRSAENGADQRRAHAVSLALAGRFVEAFETLQDLEKRDGPLTANATLSPLLALLSERAGDVTFLRYAFASRMDETKAVPTDVGNQMARRLLDLGFAEQAANWIAEAGPQSASTEQRLMRAEIALARQLPNRALVELMGLSGPEVARLRAAAMWQERDYRQAGQMLIAAEDFDGAARGFWLAEEWESVPDQADAHYAEVVADSVQVRATGADPTQMAPLAEARVLMQNSSAAREEIEKLLQTVSVEPASSQ